MSLGRQARRKREARWRDRYATEPDATSQQVNVDPLNDPNSPLAKRSIYFDFDSYSVKDDYQSLLQQHAQYLKSHPERRVLIQGNTDERGTSEYNLALGQKRAEAVRRSMSLMGVADTQMEAVSLGKEKPQATGHDEVVVGTEPPRRPRVPTVSNQYG